jgi:hypothetical protein
VIGSEGLHDVDNLGRHDGAAHKLLDREFAFRRTPFAVSRQALDERGADCLEKTHFVADCARGIAHACKRERS